MKLKFLVSTSATISKFRNYLTKENIIKTSFDISKTDVGDIIEIEGKLQKNPLINYMNLFVDIFRMVEIFSVKPLVGGKTQATAQKEQENKILQQIKSFAGELKHSGTIDYILSANDGTAVLSVQEQYLANDNILEIIGDALRFLGKLYLYVSSKPKSPNRCR